MGKPAGVGSGSEQQVGGGRPGGQSVGSTGCMWRVGFQLVFYCRAREEAEGQGLLWERRLEKV